MTSEEAVVRNAYAKLTYAVELGTLHNLAHEYYRNPNASEIDRGAFAAHLADGELRFQLNEVRVGNLADIAQVKYEDLVTKPSGGPALSIHSSVLSYTENGRKVENTETATAKWIISQTLLEDWSMPFAKAQTMVEQDRDHASNWKLARHYLSCTVTGFYQGRSITYKALWLFGANGEVVGAVDTGVDINGGALQYFLTHKVYPYALVETQMRDIPVVREWLTGHAVSSSCADHRDACCDLSALKCGVARAELQHSLDKVLATIKHKNFVWV
jgi:hypothetical protein